jgi:hypothetical protein
MPDPEKKRKGEKPETGEDGTAPVELTPTDATIDLKREPTRAERAARGIHPRRQAPPVEPGKPSSESSSTPPIDLDANP